MQGVTSNAMAAKSYKLLWFRQIGKCLLSADSSIIFLCVELLEAEPLDYPRMAALLQNLPLLRSKQKYKSALEHLRMLCFVADLF